MNKVDKLKFELLYNRSDKVPYCRLAKNLDVSDWFVNGRLVKSEKQVTKVFKDVSKILFLKLKEYEKVFDINKTDTKLTSDNEILEFKKSNI